jgi:hypothetical protein
MNKSYIITILCAILIVFIILLLICIFKYNSNDNWSQYQGNTTEYFEEKYPYKICVLAIFKNETMNLKVWLDHYLWQGVEHFYLVDNDSDDNPDVILEPYINKGLVTLYKLPESHKQVDHYKKVWELENIPDKTKWLIMADLDEFWFSPNSKLSSALHDYDDYDLIYSNWKMFGSDGLTKHPIDIRTAITGRKSDLDKDTKWICKPKKMDISDMFLHYFYNDEKYKKIIVNDKIHLNHYPIQSKEFFEKVKMSRGDALSSGTNDVRNWDYFEKYDKDTTNEDTLLKNMILNQN